MATSPKYIYLLFCAALLITFMGCKKRHDSAPVPCKSPHPVSAHFVTIELSGHNDYYWTVYVTDTVATRRVYFVAAEDSAKYEWHIGNNIYTDQDFTVEFEKSMIGKTMPITLIVKKTPDKNCFPDDDGIDSLTQMLTFISREETIIRGRYQGYNENNPSDTFTVTIDPFRKWPNKDTSSIYIENLDRNCGCYLTDFGNYIGYKQLHFYPAQVAYPTFPGYDTSDFICHAPEGYIVTNGSNDKIIIYYSLAETKYDGPINHYKFYGKKL